MSIKFCPKCGSKIESQSQICDQCGADLSSRIKINKEKPKFANFTERSLAWFIDMMIILLVVVPLSLYLNFGYFYIYTNVYLFIIGFFYFFLLEYFNKGQTLGKMLIRIRSVDEKILDHAKLTQYFLNNVTKATPFLFIDLFFGLLANYNSTGAIKKHVRITQNLSEISVIKLFRKSLN